MLQVRTTLVPPRELYTLSDYQQRFRLYKTDPWLQVGFGVVCVYMVCVCVCVQATETGVPACQCLGGLICFHLVPIGACLSLLRADHRLFDCRCCVWQELHRRAPVFAVWDDHDQVRRCSPVQLNSAQLSSLFRVLVSFSVL